MVQRLNHLLTAVLTRGRKQMHFMKQSALLRIRDDSHVSVTQQERLHLIFHHHRQYDMIFYNSSFTILYFLSFTQKYMQKRRTYGKSNLHSLIRKLGGFQIPLG
jgi:hypothetical protein